MINGSNIRLPNGQFSTLVTPVDKDGVTQLITPVDANGNVITGGGSSDPSQIKSATPPTTRANGSALQTDDRWQDTTNDRVWIRNAAGQWMSEQISYLPSTNMIAGSGDTSLSISVNLRATYIPKYTGIIIEEVNVKYAAAAPQNGTDFWSFILSVRTHTGSAINSVAFSSIHSSASDSTSGLTELFLKPSQYTASVISGAAVVGVGLNFVKNASAGNLSRVFFVIGVRDVY